MTNGLPKVTWPDGKRFAFTIFDDTDFATLENVPPVYQFLADHGFRTTKTAWPIRGKDKPVCEGLTCEDPKYLAWLHQLKASGFEIGFHMATFHTSSTEQTARGLDEFARHFGPGPLTMANHVGCLENIYWGPHRLTGIHRSIYKLATRLKHPRVSFGHVETDPRFWGDLCKARVKYVRNFVFREINTLKACPFMPYHDPLRPYVNYWYASTEGSTVESFNRSITEAAQDRLEAEGGACIMYAHLALRFFQNGRLNPQFASLMKRLSQKPGWFVPVGTLLNYLMEQKGAHTLTNAERRGIERRWLWMKLRRGTS